MIKFIGMPTINKWGDVIEEYNIWETQELSNLVQGIVNNLAGTKWKRSTEEIKIFLLWKNSLSSIELSSSIDVLDLSLSLKNSLHLSGIHYIGDLIQKTEQWLLDILSGSLRVTYVEQALSKKNFSLNTKLPNWMSPFLEHVLGDLHLNTNLTDYLVSQGMLHIGDLVQKDIQEIRALLSSYPLSRSESELLEIRQRLAMSGLSLWMKISVSKK